MRRFSSTCRPFPTKARITPRLLAGHLGGIRHYKDDEFLSAKHYDSIVEGLKIFASDPLVAPPGSKSQLFDLRLQSPECRD